MSNIKAQLRNSLIKLGYNEDEIKIDYPSNPEHGDYSTNAALVAGKYLPLARGEERKSPMEIAKNLVEKLKQDKFIKNTFEKVEIFEPGFINFYLKDSFLIDQLDEIIKLEKDYGKNKIGKGKKIQVEFISANPTGPLTLANGRGGVFGDVLANILELSGYQVEREYYINDAGNQIKTLGLSLLFSAGVIEDDESYYHGDYINKWVKNQRQDFKNYQDKPEELGFLAAQDFLDQQIKPAVAKLGVKFDQWFSEKLELRETGKAEETLNWLKEKKIAYEQNKAWWMKTAQFGDEKDRVIVTSNGEPTYFLVDIAYHKNKFERGFDKVINIWGADHHGYVGRMLSGVEALGYKNKLDIIIMQLVRIIEAGKEVRMSKRKGQFILLEDLINEVSLDVTRWFFLMRSPDTHMDFDLDLAKEQSKKNPVYYVQYAHTRLHSIIEKVKECHFGGSPDGIGTTDRISGSGVEPRDPIAALQDDKGETNLNNSEKQLIKYLLRWPEQVGEIARTYQVHNLTTYAYELADKIQKFYETSRVIENGKVNNFRLNLTKISKIVLNNILGCLGISAPEKM